MGNRLDAKVCLITGAGSGIGQASARLFAQEGARVVVADIDLDAAAKTVAEIGAVAVAERVDVTSPQDTVDLAKRVVEQFGRIDVLFNNAGIAGIGDVLGTEPELFDRVMTVNVRGVYLMTRAVVPYMIERRTGSLPCLRRVAIHDGGGTDNRRRSVWRQVSAADAPRPHSSLRPARNSYRRLAHHPGPGRSERDADHVLAADYGRRVRGLAELQ